MKSIFFSFSIISILSCLFDKYWYKSDLNQQWNQPDDILHDEGSGEDEEEGGEVDGEPGGEVFRQAVVWEEDEDDQDDEINNNPAAPYNNKQGLFPVNA